MRKAHHLRPFWLFHASHSSIQAAEDLVPWDHEALLAELVSELNAEKHAAHADAAQNTAT